MLFTRVFKLFANIPLLWEICWNQVSLGISSEAEFFSINRMNEYFLVLSSRRNLTRGFTQNLTLDKVFGILWKDQKIHHGIIGRKFWNNLICCYEVVNKLQQETKRGDERKVSRKKNVSNNNFDTFVKFYFGLKKCWHVVIPCWCIKLTNLLGVVFSDFRCDPIFSSQDSPLYLNTVGLPLFGWHSEWVSRCLHECHSLIPGRYLRGYGIDVYCTPRKRRKEIPEGTIFSEFKWQSWLKTSVLAVNWEM